MDDLLITASLFALCAACALSIARRIINRRNVQRETKRMSILYFLIGFPALTTRRIWNRRV